jgi:predicted NBD/HSP70 family sugar kinase
VIGPRQGIAQLRAAAERGDERARQIFAKAGSHLGRAVSILVNMLHPALVLVSGEGTLSWPQLEPGFLVSFQASTFPALSDVRVEVDPWDDRKWATGAAALVLEAPFAATDGDASEAVRGRLLQSSSLARSVA